MSGKKKVLRFVVTGALLGAPLLGGGCGADNDMVNEPAPEPTEDTINEPAPEPEPELQETINEPAEETDTPEEDDDTTSGIDPREISVNEPPQRDDEPAQPE